MVNDTETWITAISSVRKKFEQSGIPEAKSNAEFLAMHVLKIWNRAELRTHLEREISNENQSIYEELVARRLRQEPLQHIIGETEFFGLRFFSSPAALIPRPDTEILVEEALKEASILSNKDIQILDVGTGSGAIALALASKLSEAHIFGIDISPEAIDLAERNRKRLNLKNADFEVMDIFHDDLIIKFSSSIDLLVSNPPYISAEEFKTLDMEVREFDPRIALTDEADGLSFYRRIARIAPKILKDEGRIFVEIGYSGAPEVEEIFTSAGLKVLRIVEDLQGIKRVMVIGK